MLGFRASRRHLTVAALLLLPGALLVGGARTLRAEETSPAAEQPRQIGGAVTRPEKISGSLPVYPEAARKARMMGIVIVEAIIDENGNVTHTRVLKSLPLGLDQAALDAIRTWKFKPAALEGKPVKVYYTLTVNFQVEDTPPFGPLFQKLLEKRTLNSRSSCARNATGMPVRSWIAGLRSGRPIPRSLWHAAISPSSRDGWTRPGKPP
jgi:TonB family protein